MVAADALFGKHNWAREVHVIGLGGIGSWVVQTLIKLRVPVIHVYDDDIVEEHNVWTQAYWDQDVKNRVLKVEAIQSFAKRMGSTSQIIPHPVRIDKSSDIAFSGVVISGVDSMQAREDIWKHLKFNARVELYMDGRIGGEWFHLYTLNPSNPNQITKYEAWMYPDEEAAQAPCSVREDFHSAQALVGFITRNLTVFARKGQPTEILHGDMSAVAVNGQPASVVRSV